MREFRVPFYLQLARLALLDVRNNCILYILKRSAVSAKASYVEFNIHAGFHGKKLVAAGRKAGCVMRY